MARGFDDVPDASGYDSVRLEELFELWLPSKEATTAMDVRILPHTMLPVKTHWVEITTKKGAITVPKVCVSFDPDNQSEPLEGRDCPYCKLDHTKDTGVARSQIYYYANAIIRDLQEDKPVKMRKPTADEAKTGVKDINSKSWTPVRVIQLTPGLARRLKDMAASNKAKIKGETKTFPVNHAKFGVDVTIKFNPKASGEAKYSLDKTERTPLTEEELEYLYFDLEDAEGIYDKIGRLDTKRAVKDLASLKINGVAHEDEDADGDDDGGYKPKRKPKSDASDDSDGDSGYKPKRKKPSASSDESEEDPKPRRKKPSSRSDDSDEEPAPKRKKPSRFSDDSDDSDEEPAPKRKKPSRFSDDSDEEEEPKPKRKKPSAASDDSDEEEEPKPKRKPASKTGKPAAKRKPSRFDDDEDED